ncbi:hypothetical protein AS156_23490 [Bradyrhizobium macuxiense]|uniref:DUF4142 domain-containing protein n=2 Tax=Bradyrhizobium macuxiense TaxID=1755647 RepID=A0A109JB24_9BRAD|nr:hypothetical protein AS156_23490 [Bradyrhizobium macuxiense]
MVGSYFGQRFSKAAANIGRHATDPRRQPNEPFADRMITDHTKTSPELKQLVSGEMNPAFPAALDDSSEKKLVPAFLGT